MKSRSEDVAVLSEYISPKELARRWQCSRTSVDRIAARAGLSRVFLGEGRNGIVRYVRAEVEAFEAARIVKGGEGS